MARESLEHQVTERPEETKKTLVNGTAISTLTPLSTWICKFALDLPYGN
jgi:hypothetical protein